MDKEFDYLYLGHQTKDYQVEGSVSLDVIHRQRDSFFIDEPIEGYDRWQCYEVSFLLNQKPSFFMGYVDIPFSSSFIIESKSFKLYLNSFNGVSFLRISDFVSTVNRDLSAALKISVDFKLIQKRSFSNFENAYRCLDGLSIDLLPDVYSPSLLKIVSQDCYYQKYSTFLFRSVCPVTGQPDWACVYLHFYGPNICLPSLLMYLLSFRSHAGFHESVVDQIYVDLFDSYSLSYLTVYAKFNRRGGIDINPFRSNFERFSFHGASYSQ